MESSSSDNDNDDNKLDEADLLVEDLLFVRLKVDDFLDEGFFGEALLMLTLTREVELLIQLVSE
jgi:hypothetical protein